MIHQDSQYQFGGTKAKVIKGPTTQLADVSDAANPC